MYDPPLLAAGVREGEVLAGKYRVERVLGVGGMGVVVAARHIHFDDHVAIKFLLPSALGNDDAVDRFAREARAARKIKSEHVAHVSDVGTLENGAPYMVMEYLEGTDLAGWLQQMGRLSIEQAVDFVLQACEAIAEAHSLGIVHRDLKPANLFVIRRPDGALSVKVLDFGISKTLSVGGISSGVTSTATFMGSPQYMSPEQMQSPKDADARTDIFALGIVLYELLTGEPPFIADSIFKLRDQMLSSPPASLCSRRTDVPVALEAAIFTCLDKDRGKRFQTIAELSLALLPFAPERSKLSVERILGLLKAAGTGVDLPPPSDKTKPSPGAGTAASWGKTTPGKGRRGSMLVGGSAIAVAVGIGAVASRRSVAPDPTPAPAKALPQSALGSEVPSTPLPAAGPAREGSEEATPPATVPSVAVPSVPAPLARVPATMAAGKPASNRRAKPEKGGAITPSSPPAMIVDTAPSPPPNALPQADSPVVKPRPSSPPSPGSTPSAHGSGCNPSYYFDSHGNKHFKPECF